MALRGFLGSTPAETATDHALSPEIRLRAAWTILTQASVDVGWACVIADTALTSSSFATNASGTMRMSDPLPLSRSPEQPCPVESARDVAPPMSNR